MGQTLPVDRLPRRINREFPVPEASSITPAELDKPFQKNHDSPQETMSNAAVIVRERLVDTQRILVLGRAVSSCGRQFGVNAPYKCRDIYIQYLKEICPRFNGVHLDFDAIEGKTIPPSSQKFPRPWDQQDLPSTTTATNATATA